MTLEQLDETEKLAVDFKSATFHDLMARQTLPLVKAVRDARQERDEARAERDEALEKLRVARSDVARLWEERDEARAEVERLRGIVEVNDRRLAAVWDEARAEVERLKATLREALATIADARTEAQDILCLRDQLHRSRVVAEDERDLARAEAEVLARVRYAEQQRASKAEKERDEARAEVERLKAALHCTQNELSEHYCIQCEGFVRP